MAAKQEELAALEGDLDSRLSRSDMLKVEKNIEILLKEIDDLEMKLNEQDAENDQNNVRDRNLEKTFQKIDFAPAKCIANGLKEQFDMNGGCSLLLIQKSKKRMGNECLQEMIEIIMQDQMINDEIMGDYQSHEVSLGSSISMLDQREMLIRIAEKMGIEELCEGEELVRKISSKICSSLGLCSTIFIKISGLDELLEKEDFLCWFVNDFWKILVQDFERSSERNHNKLILALVAESQILDEYPEDLFCNEEIFETHKIRNVPLIDWRVGDIYSWLIRFGSRLPKFNLSDRSEVEVLARRIHRGSEGTPESVCLSLRKKFL